jgi:hypothetical protein
VLPTKLCFPELPDGIFSKSKFGEILEGLAVEDVGIFMELGLFYGHLEYFMDIWIYFMDIWIYFMVIRYIYPRFGILYKKIWQP